MLDEPAAYVGGYSVEQRLLSLCPCDTPAGGKRVIQDIDFAVLDWIQQHMRCGWMDWLMPKVTLLGKGAALWVCITLALLAIRRHRRVGMRMALGLVLAAVIGLLLMKNLVARPRPCWLSPDVGLLVKVPWDYSFPSGHTLMGFVCATVIALHHRRAGICAFVVAAIIAFTRLYLYVHFPTDVLAGAVLGVVLGIAACKLADRWGPVDGTHEPHGGTAVA